MGESGEIAVASAVLSRPYASLEPRSAERDSMCSEPLASMLLARRIVRSSLTCSRDGTVSASVSVRSTDSREADLEYETEAE